MSFCEKPLPVQVTGEVSHGVRRGARSRRKGARSKRRRRARSKRK